jgi:hypothetical protein
LRGFLPKRPFSIACSLPATRLPGYCLLLGLVASDLVPIT